MLERVQRRKISLKVIRVAGPPPEEKIQVAVFLFCGHSGGSKSVWRAILVPKGG
jgi:hypothetical protein